MNTLLPLLTSISSSRPPVYSHLSSPLPFLTVASFLLVPMPAAGLVSSQIAEDLVSILHQVGKEWRQEFPRLMGPVDRLDLSMFGMKNRRRKMEDRYALCLDLNSLYSLEASHTQSSNQHSLVPFLFLVIGLYSCFVSLYLGLPRLLYPISFNPCSHHC